MRPGSWLAGTMLALALLLTVAPIVDYDFFWHLANGRAIAGERRIVETELFSWTAKGAPFANHAWLAQLLLFASWELGGETGVGALRLLVVGAALWLAFLAGRRVAGAPAAATAVFVATAAAAPRLMLHRPEMFSTLGLAALLLLLLGESRRTGSRTLLAYAALFALWDVVHGAVYGFALLACFVAGECTKAVLAGRRSPTAGGTLPWRLVAALGVALAVSLASPWGIAHYDDFLTILGSSPMVRAIHEHRPIGLANPHEALFWASGAALAVGCVVLRRRIDPTLVLLAAVGFLATVRHGRSVVLFAIAATPLVAFAVQAAVDRLQPRASLALGCVALAIATALTAAVKSGWTDPAHALGFRVAEDYQPVGAVRFVKTLGIQGRMYNSNHFGGYLAYHLAPERPIFFYNHTSTFAGVYALMQDVEALRALTLDYAFVAYQAERDALFPREEWAPVYAEEAGMLLLRRHGANAAVIERFELRFFAPYRPSAELLRLGGSPGAALLRRELTDHLSFRRDERLEDVLLRLGGDPGGLAARRADVAARAGRF